MSIVARITDTPHILTRDQRLQIEVEFFDDNDPKNQGVGASAGPRVRLIPPVMFTYDTTTLTPLQMQDRFKADVQSKITAIGAGDTVFGQADILFPPGFLITATS